MDETVDLLDFDNINDVDVNVEQGHVLPWQVGRGAGVLKRKIISIYLSIVILGPIHFGL